MHFKSKCFFGRRLNTFLPISIQKFLKIKCRQKTIDETSTNWFNTFSHKLKKLFNIIYATKNLTLILPYIHASLSIAISLLSYTRKDIAFTYVILTFRISQHIVNNTKDRYTQLREFINVL